MEHISALIDQLVEQIILSEKEFDEGKGNVDSANKATDTALGIRDRIRIAAGGDMSVLKPLLKHANPAVRGWTAAELLPICEEDAKRVLTQIAEAGGTRGFTAKVVLREWSKGNWMGEPFRRASCD